MVPEREERRLAAILAADMAGYSRLMEADERDTIARQKTHRKELIDPTIAAHNGRIVKTTGDGLLVEFSSVVDAVACAVAIQRAMATREAEVAEKRRIRYRVGINLGDIVIDGDDIHGDGVNVAARLEGLADPGGICIPRKVFDEVRTKLDVGYKYIGLKKVKNIQAPLPVYRVLLDPAAAGKVTSETLAFRARRGWAAVAAAVVLVIGVGGFWWRPWAPDVEPASIEHFAFPLPERPSIAVLPFDNLSGDAEQEHLADGITETLITELSRIPDLFVIARYSTSTYKGTGVSVKRVAEEQGVRYVLAGSVQRSGERLRINAQLIDALEGVHIWAERYDREFDDLFALQDDITHRVAAALQIQLTVGEEAESRRERTLDPEAFLLAHRAGWHYRRFNKEDTAKARELVQKAREIDPGALFPLQMEGWIHYQESRFGWSESREESLRKAEEIADRALQMDDADPDTHLLLASIARGRRNLDQAIRHVERAIDLNPNHTGAVGVMALVLNYAGRPDEAIPFSEKAMRLSPVYPPWVPANLGLSYMMIGDYDKAISAYEEVLSRGAMTVFSYERLTAIHALKGDLDKAREYAGKLMVAKPSFTIREWAKTLFYKNKEDLERELGALRKAGLPERAALPLPDKPSIAVLPFNNYSDDQKLEFFVDGLTEDLTSVLARAPGLFVIARNSAATYKGKPVNVKQVAEELGVQFVLEGSVQKAGEKLRITTQLIDALNDRHVWTGRFDRQQRDVFALQDEITKRVLVEVQVKLMRGDHERVASRGTDNLEAWLLRVEGRAELVKFTREGVIRARELFESAHRADPNWGRPLAGIAQTLWYEAKRGWSASREDAIRLGTELAERAIDADPDEPLGYMALGNLLVLAGQPQRAIEMRRKAVELAPNDFNAVAGLAARLKELGGEQEAIELYQRAMRLSPKHPWWVPAGYGLALHLVGRKVEAESALKEAIELNPKHSWPHEALTAVYVDLGWMEEAAAAASEVLRLNPDFSVSQHMKAYPIQDTERDIWYRGLLLRAGLPE